MSRIRLRIVACALAALACGGPAPERVTLAAAHQPAAGLIFIAQAKGYFAAHGVALDLRRFATGRDALAALASGDADLAAAYVTPVVLRPSKGDLEILTTIHGSTRNTRLVARVDCGIRREADLAGKRVGLARGTSAEYFLHTLAVYGGVPDAAIRTVDVAPADGPRALASGSVDALIGWEPWASRAEQRVGAGAVTELTSELYTELSVLLTRHATHAARRPALVRVLAALADAERLTRSRPDEAFAALRGEFPEIAEPDLRAMWGRVQPTLGLGHELVRVLAREAEWFRAAGRPGISPLEVRSLLEPDVLRDVEPEAITWVSLRAKGPR